MATLNEIAYNLKNLAYSGNSNTEEDLSNRQIKFWIHYYRGQILTELMEDGKGVPYECLQSINPTRENDIYYGDNNSVVGGDWAAYTDANAGDNRELIVWSNRTILNAGISFSDASVVENEDFYGRDFYNQHTYDEKADYGYLRLYIPSLLNLDNGGVKNLAIREAFGTSLANHGKINIPVLSKNGFKNKKYNRFSTNSPAAFLETYSSSKTVLNIGLLRSYFRKNTGAYQAPVQYSLYADMLLNNPTEAPGWNDDMQYPFPQQLITDLNKRILTQEMNVIMSSRPDNISDNADTTKIAQPQAQGQVRKR